MAFKNWMLGICLCVGTQVVAIEESFIETPCPAKKKKLSTKQKKEHIADDLKELARNITREMKELLETQEMVIDRLDELVNNDKQGVFSGASDSLLEKAVVEVELLRDKSAQRRSQHKEQNHFLKHGNK